MQIPNLILAKCILLLALPFLYAAKFLCMTARWVAE